MTSDRQYGPVLVREGGMGLVFQGRDTHTGHRIARKTFKPASLSGINNRRQFLIEAAHWILLGEHPNIVHALRVELSGSPPQPYLILEWIDGKNENNALGPSLLGLMVGRHRRPLSFARSLAVALDVARGMRHAAARLPGLVHGDLKPANILIDTTGRALVTDFGIAGVFSASAEEQKVPGSFLSSGISARMGSPAYVAPEQLKQTGPIDQRADIFSLGCILFEMLTGLRRVLGEDLPSTRKSNLGGNFRPIPAALPHCLGELIRRCNMPNPDDRYGDWETVEYAIVECYEQIVDRPPPAALQTDLAPDARQEAEARSYLAIGRSWFDLGFVNEALVYLNRSLTLARGIKDQPLETIVQHCIAVVCIQTGQFDVAKGHLMNAVSTARRIGDKTAELDMLSTMGALYSKIGDMGQALRTFHQALELAQKRKDVAGVMVVLGNIGNTYGESGDPKKAIEYFSQLLVLCETCGDESLKAKVLASTGVAHYDLADFPQAVRFLQQALELHVNHGNIPERMYVLMYLWKSFDQLDQKDNASKYKKEFERLSQLIEPQEDGQHFLFQGHELNQ